MGKKCERQFFLLHALLHHRLCVHNFFRVVAVVVSCLDEVAIVLFSHLHINSMFYAIFDHHNFFRSPTAATYAQTAEPPQSLAKNGESQPISNGCLWAKSEIAELMMESENCSLENNDKRTILWASQRWKNCFAFSMTWRAFFEQKKNCQHFYYTRKTHRQKGMECQKAANPIWFAQS